MTARATGIEPEYTLTLSDGISTVGLKTPDKTGLRRLPRGPGVERKAIRQQTWNGGRGSERFATDTTKFYDACNAWTMVDGQYCPGPLAALSAFRETGVYNTCKPASFAWIAYPTHGSITTVVGTYARSFVATSDTIHRLAFFLRQTAGETIDIDISVRADNGGEPGTVVWSGHISLNIAVNGITGQWFHVDPAITTLVKDDTYWVTIYLDNTNTYMIGGDATAAGKCQAVTTWSATAFSPLFYVTDTDVEFERIHFFEYQRVLYAAVQRKDGAAVNGIYMNGDRGLAGGTQTTTLISDETKTWTVGELIGCVVLIIAGTNRGEYSVISDNAGDSFTLETALPTACVEYSSVYVILGSDKWTLLAPDGGVSITKPVTSVAVFNGFVYLAQGDETYMVAMREKITGSAWSRTWKTDNNYATYLLAAPHYDDSLPSIYRVTNNNLLPLVSAAKAVVWGSSLSFGTPIQVGDPESLIQSIILYDSDIHVGKEDGIWQLHDSKFSEKPIAMKPGRDERNCTTMAGWNTNLYFNFVASLERMYGTVVDDIGPARGSAMPKNRRGFISDIKPILQYMYAAVNGGATDYSSIMVTSSPGGDWHEIYRAWEDGQRISTIFYQTIPGAANRLWFHHGADVGYLTMPDDLYNPLNDSNMRFAYESHIVTGWFDFDTPELDHWFDKVRIMAHRWLAKSIRVDYRLDVDNEAMDASPNGWVAVADSVITGADPLIVMPIAKTGQRIRFRITIESSTINPPIVQYIELRADQMNEVRYDYEIDAELSDKQMLMNGSDTLASAKTVVQQIDAWMEVADQLTLRFPAPSVGTLIDSIKGHLDPMSLVTGEWNERELKLKAHLVFLTD